MRFFLRGCSFHGIWTYHLVAFYEKKILEEKNISMEILGVRLSMRASRYAIQTGMWQVSKNTVPKQNTRQFISDKEVIRLHKNIGTSI
jgi:hypothetical protein